MMDFKNYESKRTDLFHSRPSRLDHFWFFHALVGLVSSTISTSTFRYMHARRNVVSDHYKHLARLNLCREEIEKGVCRDVNPQEPALHTITLALNLFVITPCDTQSKLEKRNGREGVMG
jgi:hypothetical protein